MEEFRGAANIGRGHFRRWTWHKNGSKQNLFLFHVNHVGAIQATGGRVSLNPGALSSRSIDVEMEQFPAFLLAEMPARCQT